jgi:tetratricopeptide (TPR) repeat protein/tRNA A-37 threonylcarbamoyl transferase component Bud32
MDGGNIDARMLLAELRREMFGRREPAMVGRFELASLLGRGAHGSVYLAHDTQLGRRVAVKLLRRASEEPTARARLLREAQALARLNHPNVLTIHEVGVEGDRIFVAMEHVEGGTLARWCKEHPPGTRARFDRLLDLAIGAARGLAVAHEAGIVHRDVKPANILVGLDGRPRVGDFGLARPTGERPDDELATHDDDEPMPDANGLTRTGAVLGTPAYMAPEQLAGRSDAASDQFSLCATFWEAAYGRRPFQGDDVASLQEATAEPPAPPPPERTEVPRWWCEVLTRGLKPDPAARWPSVTDLVRELERQRGARGRAATLRRALGISFVGLAIAGVMGARELERHDREAECERLGREVQATWPGRSEAVRAGLLATDLPFAVETAAKLEPWLDRWSASWHDARREVCVRATVLRTLEPRDEEVARACLELERATVDGLLDPLAGSDAPMVAGAVDRAASVTDPASCLDPDRAARTAWPHDDRWAEVLDIRRRALVIPAVVAGGDLEGIDSARALLVEAEVLGFAPLVAELRLLLGDVLVDHAPTEAEEMLRAAYFDAIRLDLPLLAAESAIRLDKAVAEKVGAERESLEWARHAEMWLERLGERDGLLGARLAMRLAGANRDRGDSAAALEHARHALELREAILGPEHPHVASSLQEVAGALVLDRQWDAALEPLQRALEIRQSALGEEHPQVWHTWMAIASVRKAQGRLDEAARIDERVLAGREAAFGPEHPSVADVLENLANIYAAQGRIDDAIERLERSLHIRKAVLGPEHAAVARVVLNIAATYADGGRYEEALPHTEEAVRLATAAYGPDHPSVATALINHGITLYQEGRDDEAEGALLRAIAIREAAFGVDHPSLANPRAQLAGVYRGQGRTEEADRLQARADTEPVTPAR